jgi:hypothetical protein
VLLSKKKRRSVCVFQFSCERTNVALFSLRTSFLSLQVVQAIHLSNAMIYCKFGSKGELNLSRLFTRSSSALNFGIFTSLSSLLLLNPHGNTFLPYRSFATNIHPSRAKKKTVFIIISRIREPTLENYCCGSLLF